MTVNSLFGIFTTLTYSPLVCLSYKYLPHSWFLSKLRILYSLHGSHYFHNFLLNLQVQSKLKINEIPVKPPFLVGFGSFYDRRVNSMYYVDHYTNIAFRYSLADDKIFRAEIETNFTISFILPSKENASIFYVGAGHTVILVSWNGLSDTAKFLKLVCEVDPNNIMDHGLAGQNGEVVFGTYGKLVCASNATQGLYQYKVNSGVETLLSDAVITTGVAIDEEFNLLYHLDGCLQEVNVFDRDFNTGKLSKRIFDPSQE